MKIGFLGTGNLAIALGTVWAGAGHEIFVAGRSADKAAKAAGELGGTPIDPAGLAAIVDVVVVAVAWEGLEPVLSLAGGPQGSLAGKPVIDCTNAVDFATGRLKTDGSAAERVAELAPGAHVVKALHMYAGMSWLAPDKSVPKPTVAICGDDADALAITTTLIGDLGGDTAIVGGLSKARQLEEAAGFLMSLVAAGHNPRSAIPDFQPAKA
ncbi:NADPH-dependent F420 reductase [Kribbella catacumbae]|uniref:NADPH-dependent F420 reductase n=1 Tax=Kribbella catacumbae TaxID=460086 RepID=UPI000382CB22|nr:NAD(P)-binding domain-containing protein [Kribbella catacumbae]